MPTSREDFFSTLAHRRPSRILAHASFTPDLHRRVIEHAGTEDLASHYGMMRKTGLQLRRPEGAEPIDYFGRYWKDEDLPEGTEIDEKGCARVPAGYYHFWHYISPLRNAESLSEIEDYPLDDLSRWDTTHLPGLVRSARESGRISVGIVGHIYENSWQIRGYEEFLLDLVERPAWAECMLRKVAALRMASARAYARAGADYLHCGDDIANQNAMMFHPDAWRRLLLPLWREIWAEARRIHPDIRIWYHSDGNILDVIGDLLDAGVDILNPLQPECLDIAEVHRRYGDRLTLDGCIGTQSTMPWGKPEDVRARVKELIGRYGQNGGLILAPTHVLEPEVPLANIDAFFDAVREYGTFG